MSLLATAPGRLASPLVAAVAGAVAAAMLVAAVPLAAYAHQVTWGGLGFLVLTAPFAAVGFVVARRAPANPIGWILLAIALAAMGSADVGFYGVRAFALGHPDLPLARVAVFCAVGWIWFVMLMPLPIALFPDGRLFSPRLRWALVAYLAVCAVAAVSFGWLDIVGVRARVVRVDSTGELVVFGSAGHPTGVPALALHVLILTYPVFCATAVIGQVLRWRRSRGERRQQLKWLLLGGGAALAGVVVGLLSGGSQSVVLGAIVTASWACVAALPIALGVGILKYRLYEIDRIVSRTLAYAVVTGLLVGVYAGLVTLASLVTGSSSPLVVAGLFNPLRRGTQRVVDRRFNRARYDAERTVAALSARLAGTVDADAVMADLLEVVHRTLEPSTVSVWLPGGQR